MEGIVAITSQRAAALRAADRARTTSSFLVALLKEGNPEASGRAGDYTVREALDVASRRLEGSDLPTDVEADLHATLGEAYLSLELLDPAEEHLGLALERRRRLHGDRSIEVADAVFALGALRYSQSRYSLAEELSRESLERYRALGEDDGPKGASARHNLACALYYQGREAEAEPLFLEALDARARLLGESHPDMASSLQMIADLRERQGRLDESESLRRRAVEVARSAFGTAHLRTAHQERELGRFLCARGNTEEGLELLWQALATSEATVGESHPDFAATAGHLAIVTREHDPEGALELYRRALPTLRRNLAPDDPFVVNLRRAMGVLLTRDGDFEAGAAHQRDWLNDFDEYPGADVAQRAEVARGLAVCLQRAGHMAEAEDVFRETLAHVYAVLGEGDLEAAVLQGDLAYLLFSKGDSAEAEPLFRRALATWEATGTSVGRAFSAHAGFAQLLYADGRTEKAERHFRLALDTAGDDAPLDTVGHLEAAYGAALRDLGRLNEAREHLLVAREALESSLGANHPSVVALHGSLRDLDAASGEPRAGAGSVEQGG